MSTPQAINNQIRQINQVISAFPDAPSSKNDTPQEFSSKADAFVNHQAQVYKQEITNWTTEANNLAVDVDRLKTEIEGITASITKGTINDNQVSTVSVWSSQKVDGLIPRPASPAQVTQGTSNDSFITPFNLPKVSGFVPDTGGDFTGAITVPSSGVSYDGATSTWKFNNAQGTAGYVGYQKNVNGLWIYNSTGTTSVRIKDDNSIDLTTKGSKGYINMNGYVVANQGITTSGLIKGVAGTKSDYNIGRTTGQVYVYNYIGKNYISVKDDGDIVLNCAAGKKAKVGAKVIITGRLSGTKLYLEL